MRRKTDETDIEINYSKELSVDTKDPVLNHLLKTLFYYMEKTVMVKAEFDLKHHLWEDMGISVGQFLKEEIKDKSIKRFGSCILPMDDALVLVSIDISRAYTNIDLELKDLEAGFDLGNFKEFIYGLSRNLSATIHIKQLNGENAHHIIEASFKALGNSLKQALEESPKRESTNRVYEV
ncbi:imidazoleglycerol-phosphate dehydratase [Petrotoga sp. 9PW.55.5.1]|uniref:imidazoleglycerol-phosphate dehydratase HisB n=1 Tax=Petrotoga sp. 9PW.55.5.1 TaxID=1308979 RepID=UPI000DC58C50|nr:imidazoleglycerol-phosphate dehydratase HisB [Petrotoga sp. 9PW.55.5.1]RAO99174.1 imidazoleglycerol-phosphate dehydratase [Petrotoga sp. 9PW.55.5.1]